MILKEYLKDIKRSYMKHKARNNFFKNNKNSKMYPINVNFSNNVVVGKYTYGELNYYDYGDGCKLDIGCFCSIANNVFFCMGGEHLLNRISTYPFLSKVNHVISSISKGDIIVQDDVWIGRNAIILSGVTIGQGAVIGAGSVVTKSVPPYAIVAGNPAKLIRYRFSKQIIKELMKLDFKELTIEDYKNNYAIFEEEIHDDSFNLSFLEK